MKSARLPNKSVKQLGGTGTARAGNLGESKLSLPSIIPTQTGGIIGMDGKTPRRLTTPRSVAALEALFYKQEDLWLKDYSSLREKFNSSEEYTRFVDKELQRVRFRIEKVREKREELIEKEEKQKQIKVKKQQAVLKHKAELTQNQKELEQIEKELRQQEEQMKRERAKKDNESTRPETRGSKYRQSEDNDSRTMQHSLAYLQQIKPKIENLSMVAPKPKEYFEIHSKVRVIKDKLELGEITPGNLKIRRQKEIEMILNHEFRLKQKQVESEEAFRRRIQQANSKLEQKFVRYEETMNKLDEERNQKLFQREIEREYKAQNVERAKKSYEYQIQTKKDQIQIENERMQEMKQELEELKHQRTFFRQNLLEDLANRTPDEDIGEIMSRYKKALENAGSSPNKTSSGFSSLPRLKKPISRLILTKGVVQIHKGDEETNQNNVSGKISAQLSPRRFQIDGQKSKQEPEASYKTVGDNDNMTTYTDRSKLMEIQGFDSPGSRSSSNNRI